MTAGGHALKARIMSLEIRVAKLETALKLVWDDIPRALRESIIEEQKDETVRGD